MDDAIYIFFLIFKTSGFHVIMCLCSNREQRMSKCGKNISDTLGHCPSGHFFVLSHFDIICELLLDRHMETWNVFVAWNSV